MHELSASFPVRMGIAGAGLLGRLLAIHLIQRGHHVTLFDLAPSLAQAPKVNLPSRAAGWTAAGMLSPTAELECANHEVFALGLRSLPLWSSLAAMLHEAGHELEFKQRGSLLLAHRGDEGSAQRVTDLLTQKAPASHHPQALSSDDLSHLEPSIHGPAHAWMLPHEGHIHTTQAMTAMGQWLHDHGVVFQGNSMVNRVTSGRIHTEQGRHVFDWVWDVRGVGARNLERRASPRESDLRHMLPGIAQVRGVRGEIFMLHAPDVQLGRPIRLLHPRCRVYVVPRTDRMIMVGASEIESEDRSPVSLRSTVELLSAAHSVLPGLAEARIVQSEANLRPALPDNLPHVEHEAGLTRINGLFRHGWLIAPALVDQVLQAVLSHAGAALDSKHWS